MGPCKFRILMLVPSMQWFYALEQTSIVLPGPELPFQHLWGLTVGLLHAPHSIFTVLFSSCTFLAWIFCLSHPTISGSLPSSEQTQGLLQGRSSSGHWVFFLKQTNKMRLPMGAFCAVLQTQWLWWDCIRGVYMIWSASHRLLHWWCSLTPWTGKETK